MADVYSVSDLSTLVDSLKRRVAVPGEFDTVFPNTTDDDVLGLLMDGFARAQLFGYFNVPSAFVMDDNGLVTPDLGRAQGSLIVLFAAVQMVQAQVTNMRSRQSYKAGNVSYETESASNVLTAVLKQLNDELTYVQTIAKQQGVSAAMIMADAYFIKAVGSYPSSEALSYGADADRAYDYHSPWPMIP